MGMLLTSPGVRAIAMELTHADGFKALLGEILKSGIQISAEKKMNTIFPVSEAVQHTHYVTKLILAKCHMRKVI